MKYCRACKNQRPFEDFWKNRTTKDGYQSYCKECWYKTTSQRRMGPKRALELRQRQNRHLIRTFGITLDTYDQMLQSQQGVCAICLRGQYSNRRFAVDHDHKTGKIRGVLCENCNRALGQFGEDVARLNRAIEYLTR